MSDTIAGLFILLLIALLYFTPAMVAARNRHPQTVAIFITNLLFGWTGIGWGIALIWAFTTTNCKESP